MCLHSYFRQWVEIKEICSAFSVINLVPDAFWCTPSLCVYCQDCYDIDFVLDII